MSDNRYTPVSCDYHDILEAAAVKGREVELQFDQNGVRTSERGWIKDVFTADGAEFVRFATDDGAAEIRLDHIFGVREIE